LDTVWEREVVGCVRYLLGCPDPQVRGAMALQQPRLGRWSYVAEASEVLAKYDVNVPLFHPLPTGTEDAKRLVMRTKEEQKDELHRKLLRKKIHGVYAGEMIRERCDRKATSKWLSDGRLRSETEALVVAAQDGVLHTMHYRKIILKEEVSEVCRACGRWPRETIGHLLSSCATYEFHLIKDRHDRVLFQLVKAMAKALNVRMRPCYRANGGVAKNGVYESRLAELVVDCSPHGSGDCKPEAGREAETHKG
jgi:hypothetical protein